MKRIYRNSFVLGLALALGLFLAAAPQVDAAPAKTAKGNAFTANDSMNIDGYISVLVESSAGSTAINKMDTKKGAIAKASDVKYLPAPFNIGIMPKAYADKEEPLTVILLGETAAPGSVQKAFAFGVLEYEQGGVAKKALIAGSQKSPFGKLNSMEQLDEQFPGVKEIIQTWFANAGGKDSAVVKGVKSRLDALNLAGDSILKYYNATMTEADRRPMDKEGNPTTLNHPKSKNIRFEYGG